MHKKMNPKKVPLSLIFFYFLVLLASRFHSCSAAASRSRTSNKKPLVSSVVFPVTGNVYPKGYYQVTLQIGQPSKPYFLDIDTGSDLTWLQCDAPCTKCMPAPHSPYKPNQNLITCKDPLCESLALENLHCDTPEEQCDYEVQYADSGSSLGVLVHDSFPLRFSNGSTLSPRLAFGCGYNQEVPDSMHAPFADGVLGLGIGKSSIVTQLHDLGLMRNVVGHCLSGQDGGFLFFGDDVVPSSGIVWAPFSSKKLEHHYSLGPANLFFGGQATGIKGLFVVFDSGSTYSYFNTDVYNAVVSLIKKDMNGKQLKDATEDKSLPVCWKGSKPFKTMSDVKAFFKPLVLAFANAKNAQFQIQPEAYLVVTEHGNVCLGILNGTEVGLDDFNVIGDISLQDKMVIYDNEMQQIGWTSANCNRLPNVDRDYIEDVYQPYADNMGILREHDPATF